MQDLGLSAVIAEGKRAMTVRVNDVSRADGPATMLGEHVITEPGNVPVPFSIEVSRASIDDRASISVSARITVGDDLFWISDTHNPVLTRGHGADVTVMVVRTPR